MNEPEKERILALISEGVIRPDEAVSLLAALSEEPKPAAPAPAKADSKKAPAARAESKEPLMEELGNIILLLDDPDYAEHDIKILIVGVPSDVIEYYQRIPNLEPVSNRLTELPTVSSLNWGQIEDFVKRGFVGHLKVALSAAQIREIALHLEDVTLGIAQRLHEYCEILGHYIEDSGWATNELGRHCNSRRSGGGGRCRQGHNSILRCRRTPHKQQAGQLPIEFSQIAFIAVDPIRTPRPHQHIRAMTPGTSSGAATGGPRDRLCTAGGIGAG